MYILQAKTFSGSKENGCLSIGFVKRFYFGNDGCTCQTIIDDLLEHISAENEISVVEKALPSQCFKQSR